MNKPPMIKQIANYVYKNFTNDPGHFLLVSGAIGWAASCVNQTVAIMINDKIPKEQKYFLIPQEITDGIVNTLLYIAITKSFNIFGKKFVESGRIASPKIRKWLEETKKPLCTKDFSIPKEPEFNPLNTKKEYKELRDHYYQFADGIKFMFCTAGAVVSCDFVTPFVRNKIAAHRQKQSLEKDKLAMEKVAGPAQPMQNDMDKQPKKLSYYNNSYTNINGRMKI